MPNASMKLTPTGGWSRSTSPYHRGEQLVQEKAGSREIAEHVGRQVIREFMTEQHRDFYAMLPLVFVGTLDVRKRPWASVLSGKPGFIAPLGPQRLRVTARPASGDPLSNNLCEGAPLAMVGVQFETRRRNRVNGWTAAVTADWFELMVGQSFGNCPQYIQARHRPEPEVSAVVRGEPTAENRQLSERAIRLIEASDTFFVASASPQAGSANPVEGADVNHRGGRPGFVRVSRESACTAIIWPDFVGNSAFNTLGNIVLNPVAGLLFIDFKSGDTLSLTGSAEVLWEGSEMAAFRGAQRLVRFCVDEGVYISAAVPPHWGAPVFASQLARTGTWGEVDLSHSKDRRPA